MHELFEPGAASLGLGISGGRLVIQQQCATRKRKPAHSRRLCYYWRVARQPGQSQLDLHLGLIETRLSNARKSDSMHHVGIVALHYALLMGNCCA